MVHLPRPYNVATGMVGHELKIENFQSRFWTCRDGLSATLKGFGGVRTYLSRVLGNGAFLDGSLSKLGLRRPAVLCNGGRSRGWTEGLFMGDIGSVQYQTGPRVGGQAGLPGFFISQDRKHSGHGMQCCLGRCRGRHSAVLYGACR
jgi:hypothetical protein